MSPTGGKSLLALIKSLHRSVAVEPVIRVLFVCTANICRSPMALAVASAMTTQQLATTDATGRRATRRFAFDSAGTHASASPQPIDPRAARELAGRGYSVGRTRSRRVTDTDFERFDHLVAMDSTNLKALEQRCPARHADKLHRLLDLANCTHTTGVTVADVPDPYHGSPQGFANVLTLCEAGVAGLLEYLDDQIRLDSRLVD